jgi:50S ribosomal protein L16 3-hydroxylase
LQAFSTSKNSTCLSDFVETVLRLLPMTKPRATPHAKTHAETEANKPALLGGLSAQQFLDRHWQQKLLLIRRAFTGDFAPLTNQEILTLAGYEDAESRLITQHGNRDWQLMHGPFRPAAFRKLRAAASASPKWTVLVQDVQHFSHEAHALLAHFRFLPQARIDDLMVSYAVKGGGVGPHFDSYDVFLLQGSGQRRWQVSAQRDLTLQPGLPLKILARFAPTQEWVLNTGDMLYLPPGYAHNGIAETDDCVTWSIGLRAPSHQELIDTWLDSLHDAVVADDRYRDPGRRATTGRNHAAISPDIRHACASAIRDTIGPQLGAEALAIFTGRFLTAPKPHVEFLPPETRLTLAAFRRAVLRLGIALDLRTRMLYDANHVFCNGGSMDTTRLTRHDRALLQTLANQRTLSSEKAKSLSDAGFQAIYAEYARGYLTFVF